MAQPVIEPVKLSLSNLVRLACLRTPDRMGHSLRITAGCVLGILIGEIWQIPDLDLIALYILACWQQDRVSNCLAPVLILGLFTPAFMVLFFCVYLTINNIALGFGFVIVTSFIFFFLGSASKIKPFSYILGIFVSYVLTVLDKLPVGEIVTRAVLYAWLQVFIACLVILVLGVILCPSPRTLLTRFIAYRLRMAAKLIRHPEDRIIFENAQDLLHEGTSPLLKNLRLAAKEKIWPSEDLNRLRHAAFNSFAVLALADRATRLGRPSDDASCAQLARLLEETAAIFDAGDCVTDIDAPAAENPALHAIGEILKTFSDPNEEELPSPPKVPGFFLPDAFSNPEHVRFSVKGTCAVLASLILFKALDWNGIHTCVITCFIVALPTMGQMVAKLKLRITGALIGCSLAIASIIFLISHFTGITQLLLMFAVVVFFAAWIKSGDQRIAYIGLQIGLAFFLSDLHGFKPDTDMTIARDRVVGILIGNFITYAVFVTFWPASAATTLNKQFRKILDLIKAQYDAQTPLLRLSFAAKTRETVSATERMLENAAIEPLSKRIDPFTLTRYRQALISAATLLEDTLLTEAHSPAPHADPRFDQLEKAAS